MSYKEATVSGHENIRFENRPANPFAFNLQYVQTGTDAISTTFSGGSNHEGYTGILHGGVISALLDTVMAHCLLAKSIRAVTGELNVRYLEPIATGTTLKVKAWVEAALPPLYHLRATILVDDKIVCKGKAKFMQQDQYENERR